MVSNISCYLFLFVIIYDVYVSIILNSLLDDMAAIWQTEVGDASCIVNKTVVGSAVSQFFYQLWFSDHKLTYWNIIPLHLMLVRQSYSWIVAKTYSKVTESNKAYLLYNN